MRQEVIQKAPERAKKQTPNLTGIPTQMKLDFERRSGLSFDDVRVHYNSDKPKRIGALAYTQGTQVHIGPGQERHLRHELGHVVQQKVMNIPSTVSVDGNAINDDTRLETQADNFFAIPQQSKITRTLPVIQGKFNFEGTDEEIYDRLKGKYIIVKVFDSERILQRIAELREAREEYDYPTLCTILQNQGYIKQSAFTHYSYATKDNGEVTYDVLYNALKAVYDRVGEKGKPTRTQLFQAIADLFTEKKIDQAIESAEFVGNLQKAITIIAQEKYPDLKSFFEKIIIYNTNDPIAISEFTTTADYKKYIPSCLAIENFKLRHYTGVKSPSYRKILSSLSLERKRVVTRTGGHTEDSDWNTFGNVGNTFFVLMVGRSFVCKQRFIANSPSYVDIPLKDIKTPIWVSSDWLDKKNITGKAFRGSADEIHSILLQIVFSQKYQSTPEDFKECSEDKFTEILGELYNNFEVKVMGPVDLPSGISWETNTEYSSR